MKKDLDPLLGEAARRAQNYLDGLDERPVYPAAEALAKLTAFDEPLPEGPGDPLETLTLLDEAGSPATVASAGGRYFGFVIGGSLPAALAANWLAGAWDQNAGMGASSPVGAKLEDVALEWLLDVLRLPAGSGGGFVSGATMANFSGLAAARHALLERQGWNVEAQGLFAAPPLTVVVGEEVHVSLLKALGLLGLGRERVVRVPVDDQGRMRPDALPGLDERTIVCIQAGNVNSGAFDPAAEICPHRPPGRRLGARRWRLRIMGRGCSHPGPPGCRRGPGRFVGYRCPQMAERALRQRPGFLPGCRGAAGSLISRAGGLPGRGQPARADGVHA